MLSRLGAQVVSADRIVHHLLREDEELKSAVVSNFGERVLAADGSVDREKLAGIVFRDRESLAKLTDLLYPRVRLEITRVFEEARGRGEHDVCVAEVPLLIEGGALDLYDVIIVVTANYRNQSRRYFQRGGKSRSDLDRRIRNQMDLAEKVKFADYVVDNDGTLEHTFEQVKKIYERIRLGNGQPRGASWKLSANGETRSDTNKGNRKSGK